jgi:ABC-2 type transport system ATP-binding protein
VSTLLAIKELSFGYPGRNLFKHFSLTIGPGLTWIKGNNGCGKSTLLRLMGGASKASVGQFEQGAISLAKQPIEYKKNVYWMGPDAPAFDHLSAQEFWLFIAGLYSSADTQLASQLAQQMQFTQYGQTPMRALSSGNQRKAALIAALSANCPVTLLDEPYNALDASAQAVLTTHLTQQMTNANRAWVMTSHALSPTLDSHARTVEL